MDLVYGIADSRDAALGLVEKYQDRRLADRVFELAWTHAQVVLRQINAREADAQLYGRLANSVIYAHAALRADSSVLMKNRRGQSGLWGYAISGDLPIVLLRIADLANIELVRQLIQAHAYWRLKGLAVDLVIWNEDRAGYRQVLQDQILGLVAVGVEAQVMDRPGGIFVRSAEQISEEDRTLFQTVARAIFSDSRGTLAEQVSRHGAAEVRVPRLVPSRPRTVELPAAFELPRRDLILFNGIGGFTRGWPRICHHHHARTAYPGTVGERAGQSPIRQRHLGERPGLYLGRERPRVPPYALAQRPGLRRKRRSLLSARRGERPVLVADTAAQARCNALRQPTRLRLQRVRAYRGRHPLRVVGLRGPGRGGQILACSRCATPPAGRAGCPPRATWNGCWATCGRNRPCT